MRGEELLARSGSWLVCPQDRSWLAHSGVALHTWKMRRQPAHSGEPRALSVPCSLPWSIAVTSSCCAHRPLLTLQQLIPAGMLESPSDADSGLEKQSLGGLQPPRLPSWVWGMGSVLWSRHPAPCALLNVEFVFLCFSCSPLSLHFYFSFGNMASIPGVGIS